MVEYSHEPGDEVLSQLPRAMFGRDDGYQVMHERNVEDPTACLRVAYMQEIILQPPGRA